VRVLIVGATGFVGRKLAAALIERGMTVAAMVRNAESPHAQELAAMGAELRVADLTDPDSLEPVLRDIDLVYYLAHLMSADGAEDLAVAETDAATALGKAAKRAGVRRVIYLGGLGDTEASVHLRARHATALALRESGPPLTYFRAAMVVGAESGSYQLLKDLVERLPAMVSPEWLENRTQPIGVDDVVEYLADAAEKQRTVGRQIQLGGPDVLSYSEMVEGMARALGEKVPMRLPTPRGISSEAVGNVAGAVSRGDPRVAEHITAGLATDTLVEDPSGMKLFDIEPDSYRIALARAIEEEARAEDAPAEATATR
jgi:uncharacterized protein YbjT (DUF2867 family)